MKTTILIFLTLAHGLFAQSNIFNHDYPANLATVDLISTEYTKPVPEENVTVKMPNLSPIPDLHKPPKGFTAEGNGYLVTKNNQKELGINVAIEAVRSGSPELGNETIDFKVFIPRTGATADYRAASLFLMSTNRLASRQNPHSGRIDVPLHSSSYTLSDNNEKIPMLRFRLPEGFANAVFLQLDCRAPAMKPLQSDGFGGSSNLRGKVYAVQLKTYIPKKPITQSSEENKNNDKPVKVKVDVSL